MTKKTIEFFRELYEPLLVRSDNKRVTRSILNRAASAKAPRLNAEQRRALAKLGGQARRKTLTPEVRSYLAALMTDARKRIPAEVRRRSAATAAKARWASKTPEERKAHSDYLTHKRRGKKMGEWTAVWPFP